MNKYKKLNNYKKLSIIIPAYNESKTIKEVLQAIADLEIDLKKEIIVIDDGSKDNPLEIAKSFSKKDKRDCVKYKILQNPQNLGKTQTVRRGILESTGDLVVIQDADLEYEPKDLIDFVETFKQNPDVDVIYGNRFARKFENKYFKFYFGNRVVTTVSNFFTMWRGAKVGDMETCYKMARGDIFRDIGKTIVSRSTFGLEPELTAKFFKYKKDGKKLKYNEIPIQYRPRTIEEGKKMKVSEGFKALIEIVRFNVF